MDFERWEKIYRDIKKELNLIDEKEKYSAKILNEIINEKTEKNGNYVSNLISEVEKVIKNNDVNIFGAGDNIELVKKIPSGKSIACDGATTYFLELTRFREAPDIVITDLDGRIRDILKAEKLGSIVIIHAHGDNAERIKKHASKFAAPLATTQIKPFGMLFNFGGFTDGDRAIFLAEHFKAKKIKLYGFDFSGKIGKYSFADENEKNIELKKKKLKIAEKLINNLKESSEIEITFA